MNHPHILITGGAGFIGSHLSEALLREGYRITLVDNFDPFYAPAIKYANLAALRAYPNWRIVDVDIRNRAALCERAGGRYDAIIHLAAKAGVRPSFMDPEAYRAVNVRGTYNLLAMAREYGVPHFVFASSSSVYGVNPNVPWREDDGRLQPISPYARTKVRGELMGRAFSKGSGMRFVALRFFTVYGPRQRPDLAIHKFAGLMLRGKPIPFYGDGSTSRDYTYIDDIVCGIRGALRYTGSMYEIINLGNNRTVSLREMVSSLEDVFGVRAKLDYLPEQTGDVPRTSADISKAGALLGYQPQTPFRQGLRHFAGWLTSPAACNILEKAS